MSETQSSPSNLNLSTSTNQTDSASNSFNNKSWVLQSSFLKYFAFFFFFFHKLFFNL